MTFKEKEGHSRTVSGTVYRANRARLLVKELTAQRAALVCEHEQALRMLGYFRNDPMTYLADGTSVPK